MLYASTHQVPLFPGTGAASETRVGNIFNATLAPGAGAELRKAFAIKIPPALNTFQPALIIVSAGFDAHKRRRFRLGDARIDEIG